MFKRIGWLALCLFLCTICNKAYSQQDVDFHLSAHLLSGKKIIKVKRDYYDPYLWVLTQNDEVYRVNSLTQAIDDYTAAFSAYNNLQFTDIAGRSQDTVFIGTNSSTLLEYQKGAIKNIGPPNNITGSINQVGMDYKFVNTFYSYGSPQAGHKVLMIATTTQIFFYDDDTQITASVLEGSAGNNKLFENTYRSEIYSNLDFSDYYDSNDSTKSYPILSQAGLTLFGGGVWYGNPTFGYNINSVYIIKAIYNDPSEGNNGGINEVQFMTQLWGTETGLWQNNWDQSYYLSSTYKHYLNGIKVNKITSIYGLANFPQLLKENVLIGTDQGLYFTNSAYGKYVQGPLNDYNTFTLDADIGNQPINDVCVDANSYLHPATVCEGAVWVATNNGLYFIKPDYSNYVSTAPIKAISFQNQPDTLSTLNICSSDSTIAAVNTQTYGGINIQWYKNGAELPAESKDTLHIKTAGDYYAVLYDPCANIDIASNHLKVNVISGPVFTFNYPDKLQYCDSASTTLNVTYSPSYHYRWYQNGELNGDTTSSLKVIQAGKYKVEVSACTNSWMPSKEVQVTLLSVPDVGISINEIPYCQGDTAIFSSTEIVDTTLYTFRWYRDNVLLTEFHNTPVIKTVTPGSYTLTLTNDSTLCSKTSSAFQFSYVPPPAFTFNYPDVLNYCSGNNNTVLKVQGSDDYGYRWYKDGVLNGITADSITVTQTGQYKVEVTSCRSSWVASKTVQVNFIQIPAPVIKPDKRAYCLGDQASLSLNIPVDPSYNITWLRDGNPVDSYNNMATIITSIPGNYTALISSTAINNCLQTSSAVQVSFNPVPSVGILENVNTNLCQGQGVTLKAVYNNGSVKWSTGETTDQITVNNTGTYQVTLTSPAGCTADTSIAISFFPDPVLNVNDTTICVYKNQVVVLTAPAGFAHYLWNSQSVGQTYTVTSAQTVNLTVTDANGCQASQQIHVTEQCPEVEIPNTFTPNGDGINDTWIIDGINNDPTVSLKVFNRYGSLIYKSNGYSTPWNGEYNGGKVPSGVYYYILTTKKGKQTFSGSVTILY
jgi:gliding motility-associated-like protein